MHIVYFNENSGGSGGPRIYKGDYMLCAWKEGMWHSVRCMQVWIQLIEIHTCTSFYFLYLHSVMYVPG